MNDRMAAELLFHGMLLLVVGMLVGLPFHDAITQHWGPEAVRAWRVAHTSLVSGGTLYLALAAVAHRFVLSRRLAQFVVRSLVLAAYLFIVGYAVGPAIGARGLVAAGPPAHVFVFALFAVGLFLLSLCGCILLWGAFLAIRHGGRAGEAEDDDEDTDPGALSGEDPADPED